MSDFLSRIEKLSPKRLALLAVQLQTRLDRIEGERAEPIAIIGMGCRFPGAPNPEAFWRLLEDGRDAVSSVPADRWDVDAFFDPDPDAAGRIASRWGGFLDRVDTFDAPFFGISRREAVSMDPQQRLALEVAWEALEHAGQSPRALSGTETGVFLGMSTNDYYGILRSRGLDAIDAYMATGSAHSVAAGRIAYVLGLQGPNFAVDTACSSSLIAIHLACQSLRMSECRLAIAGGVNVIAAPEVTVALSRSHMMAPDGRCKAFDAAADGFVRGEGCGMLVLKRLSHAVEDGDRILAVIRGSATNQDGRSSGITAPNGAAQRRVIRAALAAARVTPGDVDYVEAHGTGTSLGDPIEAHALAAEFAGRGADRPLVVGSVKANVGHLEAAAGVAGVMKVVLALQHGRIPSQLHFHQMNPHIDWGNTAVDIPVGGRDWRAGDRARIAGVSSFGFGGSNAHLILEEAPAAPAALADAAQSAHPARALDVLVLSARTPEALNELIARYATTDFGTASAADITRTASVGRAHFSERAAFLVASRAELHAALRDGKGFRGSAETRARVAFLLTGQGSQWPDMGRELYDTEPVFRAAMDECARLLAPKLDRPMLEVLYGDVPDRRSLLDDAQFTQTTLFALQWSLAQLWKSWGIEPAVILGHSVGEYAALTIAGVWSLEDGIAVIAERARLTKDLGEGWGMAAAQCSLAQVETAIAAVGGQVSIAAVNAPESTVLSGRIADLSRVEEMLIAAGVEVKRLRVSQAFHSPQMTGVAARLAAFIGRVQFNPPRIPLVSSVTGEAVALDQLRDADYWRRQVCERVEFQKAMESVATTHDVFLEIGPSNTLLTLGRQCVDRDGQVWVSSLRRDNPDLRQILESVAQLYVRGVEVDWTAYQSGRPGRTVTLPTYPFQRQRYWADVSRTVASASALSHIGGHAMLRGRIPAAIPVFQAEFSVDAFPYLGDHRVGGAAVLPGAVFIELAMAVASEEFAGKGASVRDVQFREPLSLGASAHVAQIVLARQGATDATFEILSRADDGSSGEWLSHVSGAIRVSPGPTAGGDLDAVRRRVTTPVAPDAFFEALRSMAIDLGPQSRGIRALWRGDREVLAEVSLDDALRGEMEAYRFHPALLDSCLQTFGAALWCGGESGTRVLTRIGELRLVGAPSTRVWCHAEITDSANGTGRLSIFDESGTLIAEATGLEATALERAMPAHSAPPVEDWFYRLDWIPAPAAERSAAGAVLADGALATELNARASTLFDERHLDRFDTLHPELDSLVAAYIGRAFDQLGVPLGAGAQVDASASVETAGIVPRHRRLFRRLFAILAGRGFMRSAGGDAWEVVTAPPSDAEARLAALQARYPEYGIELSVTARCAAQLADILRGSVDPLQLLFPGGSVDELQQLYTQSPSAHVFNPLIRRAVDAVADSVSGRPIRVLEIGAGTGGTTAFVVPGLSPDRVEYTFTDVSPLFLARAQERFAQYPFMRYEPLDIEAPASDPVRHDIVIAANVLHATADLRKTLRHARERVAPGGVLILLEGTRPESWVDVTFGMSEGWWAFRDADLRPDYPLVDTDTWLRLLSEEGFTNVSAVAPAQGAQQVVLLAQAPVAEAVGRWLIVSDRGGTGSNLQRYLIARGGVADLHAGTAATIPSLQAYDHVVDLRPLDVHGPSDEAWFDAGEALAADVLALMRATAAGQGSSRLWLVTRGAQPVGVDDGPPNAVQAAVWGLGRTFALEHPGAWGGLCDLDPNASPTDHVAALVERMLNPSGEDQDAMRNGTRYVPRLVRRESPRADAPTFSPTGKYLITGGLGNLGLRAAEWMVDRGARHLVLNGRTGLPDRAEWIRVDRGSPVFERVNTVRGLEERGAVVDVLVADLTEPDGRAALAGAFAPGELRGVLHTAAVFDGQAIAALDADRLAAVVRPKVLGAIAVGELAREKGADFVVLFSSTTSHLGSGGMGAYAAANQFVDSYAAELRSNGVAALAVNWGTWDALRDVSEEGRRDYLRAGLHPMRSADALDALGQALASSERQITIAQIDWSALKSVYQARRRRPMLDLVANRQSATQAEEHQAASADILTVLGTLPAPERNRRLLDLVRTEAASVLGLGAEEVDLQLGLFDMGMDSLMSVELRSRLAKAVGRKLPSTLTFNYPNVNALAGYLGTLLAAETTTTTAAPVESAPAAPTPARVDTDSLSEDELAALLADSLQTLDGP